MPSKRTGTRVARTPIVDWIEGEPPPPMTSHIPGRSGWRSPVLSALKAWPGRWGVVYSSPIRSSATSRTTYLKSKGCEAVTRRTITLTSTQYKVYARGPVPVVIRYDAPIDRVRFVPIRVP
jgi:hypothetical protein